MKKIIYLSVIAFSIASCSGSKEDKKEGDKEASEIDAEASKMCECFKAGLNDSAKYMECSDENAKIRAKYQDDIEKLQEYDTKVMQCNK